MGDTESNAAPIVRTMATPCRHLRTTGMYVYDGGESDETRDDYDHSGCWCLQTMKNFGPDDDRVGGRECRDESRSCYEPL
jgi:hypothetical protein